jgi:hypothetical protein
VCKDCGGRARASVAKRTGKAKDKGRGCASLLVATPAGEPEQEARLTDAPLLSSPLPSIVIHETAVARQWSESALYELQHASASADELHASLTIPRLPTTEPAISARVAENLLAHAAAADFECTARIVPM